VIREFKFKIKKSPIHITFYFGGLILKPFILDFIGNKELVIISKAFLYGQPEGCANYKQSP
jgi:hypothetical protein